jgi:phosphoglycolate phosphatase
MKYKMIIFDFDGTLADSFQTFLGILNQTAEVFRFRPIHLDELDLLRTYDARQLLRHLGVPAWKMPWIARHLLRQMSEGSQGISLFSGVSELLQRLAEQGVALAIVSSNSQDTILRVLGPSNAALLSYCEGGAPLFGKAGRLKRVLRRSGLPHHQVLCVGDEIRDGEAARKANISFGAVAWGYTQIASLLRFKPREVFHSLEDIEAAVFHR